MEKTAIVSCSPRRTVIVDADPSLDVARQTAAAELAAVQAEQAERKAAQARMRELASVGWLAMTDAEKDEYVRLSGEVI